MTPRCMVSWKWGRNAGRARTDGQSEDPRECHEHDMRHYQARVAAMCEVAGICGDLGNHIVKRLHTHVGMAMAMPLPSHLAWSVC